MKVNFYNYHSKTSPKNHSKNIRTKGERDKLEPLSDVEKKWLPMAGVTGLTTGTNIFTSRPFLRKRKMGLGPKGRSNPPFATSIRRISEMISYQTFPPFPGFSTPRMLFYPTEAAGMIRVKFGAAIFPF